MLVLILVGILFVNLVTCSVKKGDVNQTTAATADHLVPFDILPGECPDFPAAHNFVEESVFGKEYASYKTVYRMLSMNSTSFANKTTPTCCKKEYNRMANGSFWVKMTLQLSDFGDNWVITGQMKPIEGYKGHYQYSFTKTDYTENAPDVAITVVGIDEINGNYIAMVGCANIKENNTHILAVSIKTRNGTISEQEYKDAVLELESAGLKGISGKLQRLSIDC